MIHSHFMAASFCKIYYGTHLMDLIRETLQKLPIKVYISDSSHEAGVAISVKECEYGYRVNWSSTVPELRWRLDYCHMEPCWRPGAWDGTHDKQGRIELDLFRLFTPLPLSHISASKKNFLKVPVERFPEGT